MEAMQISWFQIFHVCFIASRFLSWDQEEAAQQKLLESDHLKPCEYFVGRQDGAKHVDVVLSSSLSDQELLAVYIEAYFFASKVESLIHGDYSFSDRIQSVSNFPPQDNK